MCSSDLVTRADGPAVETSDWQSAAEDDSKTLLIVRAGPGPLKTVELSRVTRLEHAQAIYIETAHSRSTLQYRGRLMPVLEVEGGGMLASSGVQPLLVFAGEGYVIGLAVDEIIDVVEAKLDIELCPSMPGVLGSAIVAGKAVEVLDVDYYLVKGLAEHARRPAHDSSSERQAAA